MALAAPVTAAAFSALAALLALGCSASSAPAPGQVMLVLETDGGEGRSLDFDRITVVVSDARAGGQIAKSYDLTPERLPGTVAIVGTGANAAGAPPTQVDVFATDEKGALRIYQSVRVVIPSEGVRTLRVKLESACDGIVPRVACPGVEGECARSPKVACTAGQACLAGRCVPVQEFDASELPPFASTQVGACEPEAEGALCERRGVACGAHVFPDTCGTPRIVRCGACDGEGGATTAKLSGPGLDDCGPLGAESCARSIGVRGGAFDRFSDPPYPATVSDFRLDKYEVTVGRFRKFVDAWVGGWRPAAGSGKHAHLNGGAGLANTGGGFESGWDPAWSAYVGAPSAEAATPSAAGAGSLAAWSSTLACSGTYATWTSAPAANERRPQNCVSWFDLHAFCIWDGGFLPSEAEWGYAARGGAEARDYPWGAAVPTAALASFYLDGSARCMGDGVAGCTAEDLLRVGSLPAGDGRWGHSDLAGNVFEWAVDWYRTPYDASCVDCARTTGGTGRTIRGGAFTGLGTFLTAIARNAELPALRRAEDGGRCARVP